jgi:hypothetical protein
MHQRAKFRDLVDMVPVDFEVIDTLTRSQRTRCKDIYWTFFGPEMLTYL